jgi:hypothetical protein
VDSVKLAVDFILLPEYWSYLSTGNVISAFGVSLVKNTIFCMVLDYNLIYKYCMKQYLHFENYKHSIDGNFFCYAL